jgi:hypothetical protein
MKSFLPFLILFIVASSCVKNNPDPAWIEVNEWTLENNLDLNGLEGELSHNITEAWVYVNDDLMGVFEVPFKIPVLKSGASNIKIYPAIKNNGISATKKIYPFLDEFELNTDLVPNEVLTINPVTRYKDGLQFFIEDFEDAAIKIENDPNSSTTIFTGNDPLILQSFNGNFYGRVDLNTTDTTWIAYTNFETIGGGDIPRGAEAYLEIDFHNTNNLITGLLAISPSSVQPNPNIQLNAQSESTVKWKKIYIDLRELVGNSSPQAYFEHSFQAELDEGETQGVIIIDNIKLIHF